MSGIVLTLKFVTISKIYGMKKILPKITQEVVLIDVIETSSNSYSGSLIDLCNEYGGTLKSYISF